MRTYQATISRRDFMAAVAGAASMFDLGQIFTEGGYLMAMATWTVDAGYGVDDLAVFITSEGEVAVYRGGTWLLPFHRMVPLPRSFAADAHDCIMVVGLRDPTEYKVVAREFRVPWHWELHSDQRSRCDTRQWRVDWKCSASRLALTRARFAAGGLDPSALPVCVARHSVGALRQHSAKDKEGDSSKTEALDN